MTEFTKEQEEEIKRLVEESENRTIYICVECGEKLKGMKNVRKHKEENWDHFEYELPGSKMRLGFL